MITTILIVLWFVFSAVLAYFLIKNAINNTRVFPFQDYGKTDIPYITLDVQGVPLNMIVDTGCGISILLRNMVDKLPHENSPRQISMSALTSDSLATNVVSIPISFGKEQIVEDFALYDGEDIADFRTRYGIALHGLIGNEFMEKTGCKIDFTKHALIIP